MNCDVFVIGGGPAGATVARLLARRGFSVELQYRPLQNPLVVTLPPSIRNVFHLLGIQDAVDAAGFYRTSGNTSWWGTTRRRVENYFDATGYQVLRSDFDGLLLTLAEDAGVRFARSGAKPRFTLDCSGRTGALARKRLRVALPDFRTVALCGLWRGVCRGVNPTHTLVEAYRDGWAWSIPLARDLRYVTVMTYHGRNYRAELAKTRVFQKLLANCVVDVKPWGFDASLYYARRYAGKDFLLVGDAGSFVDPISSFGVKKAMTSAWLAAAVVTTCLRHPDRAAMALDYFNQCERQTYADHLRQAAMHYAAGSARFPTPFWRSRAALHRPDDGLQAAWQRLRAAPELCLRRGPGVRFEPRPAVEGEEIVLRPTLVAPELPPGLEYFYGVNLRTLVEMAESQRQVPEFFAAYNDATLPAFITALSYLIATNVLVMS